MNFTFETARKSNLQNYTRILVESTTCICLFIKHMQAYLQFVNDYNAVPAFGEASKTPPWASRLRGPRAYAGKKWKISKIAATKCHIVSIKCTKFDFCSSSAPDPVGGGGAYSTLPKTSYTV